jgi:hypothetical protein
MKTVRPARVDWRVLVAAAALAGCDSGAPVVCTDVFAISTVAVVDSRGAPVVGAAVTATLVRTGETLSPTWLGLLTPGTYVIVDDGSRAKLRAIGDTLAITVQRDAGPELAATYVFDVPGGCHVHKVSGPDTLAVP